ncbi:hypothetical protein HO173_008660 [Letharia columbiana]|uniref:Zn(2)-C6 fungal-type domain-containing protein n=1 Tax=Letharia columbiana TaxID=112416 RepID=A0A8H6FR12_9LECA|nr:uncharacterized protein HO173_008660 [Letharia columbiana]KAF6233116.1 hypothetical protein HO173_008660 [Letharia columbiana]
MVYCGRPSKGCAPCRAKRTKCDQTRPHCGQCRRAHRECPGYRAEQDAVFRNETSKVVAKAQTGTKWEISMPVSPIRPIELTGDGDVRNLAIDFSAATVQMVERTKVTIRTLSVPLEDEATYYFFHNFVPADPASLTTYSDVLPTVYRQDSSFNALPKIIEAIGLAGISNVKQAPELMVAAGQKYARVLRAITASIQNSKEVSTDQTLMAVMLLGLFETVTCSNPESMRSWTNHVNGATALVRLRGTDQLRTKVGRKLFDNLVVQILIDCLQRRQMIPPDVIEWAEIAAEGETKKAVPERQLIQIIGRLCALRAAVDRPETNDIGVATLANFIDSDLEDWKNSLPPAFSYSIKQSPNTEDVFSHTYHVYKGTWALSVWNVYRCARILTQQVITAWLSRNSMPNPALDQSQRRQSKVLLANLAHDICASAPFILGASNSSVYSSRLPRAAAGASLLWPFYLVATMDQCLTGIRAWIITRLALIGRLMGIKQAESLANVLRTKREITAWDKFETARADEVLDEW